MNSFWPLHRGVLLVLTSVVVLQAEPARCVDGVGSHGSSVSISGDTASIAGEEVWHIVDASAARGQRPTALALPSPMQSAFGPGLDGQPPDPVDPSEWALGDETGVSWVREGSTRRAALPVVRDLVFDARGELWIGTIAGLYRWTRQERPRLRRLGPGEAAGRINRLTHRDGTLLVSTDAGVFWSRGGAVFQRLPHPGTSLLARAAVLSIGVGEGAVTMQSQPDAPVVPDASPATDAVARGNRWRAPRIAEVWVIGATRLLRLSGIPAESGLRVTNVAEVDLPRIRGEAMPVDLVIDDERARLALVYDDAIAVRRLVDAVEHDARESSWEIHRPVLAPGALIRRLRWAAGRVYLATTRGLMEAERLAGPFRRAPMPAGAADCVGLVRNGDDGLFANCREGLLALAPASAPDRAIGAGMRVSLDSETASRDFLTPDPPLVEIRRRALAHAGLDVGRADRLRRGLWRRAYWPELSLRFGSEFDRDRGHDRDQSFISGETRHLADRSRDDNTSFDALVSLEWDLGGIVYPLESVDLSRELRLVLALRDDVLDEIHQLYFERQRIRVQLEQGLVLDPGERLRLRMRASEIAAGLDAWTGEWGARWRADHEHRARMADPSAAAPAALVRSPRPGPESPRGSPRERPPSKGRNAR